MESIEHNTLIQNIMFTNKNVEKSIKDYQESISNKKYKLFTKATSSLNINKTTRNGIINKHDKHHTNNKFFIKHNICYILYKLTNTNDFFKKFDDIEELNFRIKFVETLKENSGWIKTNKIKLSNIEIEAIDVTKDISISGFFFKTFALFYKLNILVIKDNIYKIFNNDDIFTPQYVIIFDNNKCNYKLIDKNEKNNEIYENAKSNLFEYSKPLKSITSYKVDDLKEFSRRLNINTIDDNGKQFLKKIIYEKILSKLYF